jgi:hypothetical protein
VRLSIARQRLTQIAAPIIELSFALRAGGGERLRMDFVSKFLGYLAFDREFELGAMHDRQVGSALALANPQG